MSRMHDRVRRFVVCLVSIACSGNALLATEAKEPNRPSALGSRGVTGIQGFVENRGQWPADVKFFARAGGIDATLLRDAIVLRPVFDRERGVWPDPVIMRFPTAQSVEGEGVLPTLHHFLLGATRTSGARGFDHIVYHGLRPGIDLVFRIETPSGSALSRFAYDFHVAPNATLEELVVEVSGVSTFEVGRQSLWMTTSVGTLEHRIGSAWQIEPATGAREDVPASFRALGECAGIHRMGFDAPNRDPARAFVLDPSLIWGTYIGGPKQENFKKLAVDAADCIYVACDSFGATPTTPAAYQSVPAPAPTTWIGKLSANGQQLLFGTYLGGSQEPTNALGLDIDSDGTIVVFGHTWAPDFPTTPGSYQPGFSGLVPENDLFLTRLRPDGSDLVWSTFYGSTSFENAGASAMFPNGDIVFSASPGGPTPNCSAGAFDTVFGPGKMLLACISRDGTQRKFQTYFRGGMTLLEVDSANKIYMAGSFLSQYGSVPTTPGAFKTAMAPNDTQDGFVAKMSGNGSYLEWATYLGGDTNMDKIWGLAIDAASAVYVSGQTGSTDFPVTPGAFQAQLASGSGGGFVAKLLPWGTGLVWSTYLAPTCTGASYESTVAVDASGRPYSAGASNYPCFPITADALQPNYLGSAFAGKAHYSMLNPFGENLVYSSWVGGAGGDYSPKLVLTDTAELVVGFQSYSSSAATTLGAYDTTYSGSLDLVVEKFILSASQWTVMGGGKAGATEQPILSGDGDLIEGAPTRLSIRGACHHASGVLLVGLSVINAPVLGGLVVPAPDLVLPIAVDSNGHLDVSVQWPSLPSGLFVYLQAWFQDTGESFGWSATNALKLESE